MRTVMLCLVVGYFLPAPLRAEERGQVSGSVMDSSGGVLAGASVTVMNQDTGIRRSVRSGTLGDYAVGALPAGSYKVTARKAGFQTVARLDVHLHARESTTVDFTMQVGSMREVVNVQGMASAMNVDDAAAGTIVSRGLNSALPATGRGILQSVELAPGVITTPAAQGEAGQFTVNGQRPNANYFSVDGVSANSGVSGSATPAQFSGGTLPAMTAFGSTATLSPDEAIDELRIQTSGFAPEFGHTPGAQVEVTTRSGTNELHGSLMAVARSQTFDANDWFGNRAGLTRAPAAFFDGGITLGGPVRRDRTFAFAAFEVLRMRSPYTWEFAVPSTASRQSAPLRLQPLLDAFPQANGPALAGGAAVVTASASRPARSSVGTLRVDHALTARVSIFGRYQTTPSSAQNGFAQVDHARFLNDSFTFGTSAQASPNMVADTRVNVTRTSVTSSWTSTGDGGSSPINLASVFPNPAPAGTVLYGFAVGGIGQIVGGEASRSRQTQWQTTGTLAWTRNGHALRFGADYNQLSPVRDRLASSIAGWYRSLTDLLANTPMVVSQSQAAAASSRIDTLAVFAQDTWRLSSRVTLNYGVRWEFTPAPSDSGGAALQPATLNWPTRYTQFAPRAGLAYQLSNGTVLRAGWGVFYDADFAAATDPINAFPYNRWQFATQSGGLPIAPVTGPVTGAGFAPNLRLPYTREWNVAIEHEFGVSDVVTASYIGSEGRSLLRREAAISLPGPVAASPIATNLGSSNFEGLDLHYRRKLAAGWQGIASYTWSRAIDNGSWDSGIYLAGSAASDRSFAAFDVRHNLSSGLSWRHGHWVVSGLITARSGFPIDVLSSENLLGLEFDDYPRPNRIPGVPLWIEDATVPGSRRLNPAAFSVAPAGQQGNLGRNALRGFGMGQADLALEREFSVREGALSFRLEAFNAVNHPQLADPVRYLNNPFFGTSVSMLNSMLGSGTPHSGVAPTLQVGGSRVLQGGIRFSW
jgi:hypothetical protein